MEFKGFYLGKITFLFFFSFFPPPPDPAIVNGVYWSESLNKVFVDNFDRDPSLIWQYFGSAKGFFRQYPGKNTSSYSKHNKECYGCKFPLSVVTNNDFHRRLQV